MALVSGKVELKPVQVKTRIRVREPIIFAVPGETPSAQHYNQVLQLLLDIRHEVESIYEQLSIISRDFHGTTATIVNKGSG